MMRTPARILVVDDNPANILALEAILEPLGHALLKAGSGEEALKLILLHDVAAILLDIQMPGLGGFETARLIKQRERSRHIPILFLTAYSADEEQVFRGYEHGAVDYIRKPIDADILRSKVRVFVELYERGEEIRRQAELLREHELEALERRSEERYRSFIDAMPQCVWAVSPDGEVQYANAVWHRYAGVKRGETTRALVRSRVHPEDLENFDRAWSQATDRSVPVEFQLRLRHIEGEYRWHLARGAPERRGEGASAGWIATATDIHDQKEIESALQEAEIALRAANEAKDVFLAAASHELRTPITVVKAQAELAIRRLSSDACDGVDAARFLRTIARQTGRMARLVEDLLDVGRLQSGRLALELEEFDLSELLEESRDRLQLLSEEHPLELHAAPHVLIRGDRGRIEQVVTNLISNAIRYSPEGGKVDVALEASADHVHVAVRDRGVGIDPASQQRIFERFGQAHGANYGGLGLGLTIAQGIVEQHGGRIWVESSGVPGEGSTFHVLLPRGETVAALQH